MYVSLLLSACCSSTSLPYPTHKLKLSWSRGCEIAESSWLTDTSKQLAGADDTCAGDATQLRWELVEVLVRCVVFLSGQSVVEPSWGDREHHCIWRYLYFGSVVGPWLYLDECNDIYAIVWRGDCKPTMYLFSYSVHGLCEDYPTCDIAFNAVMSLSHATTRGSYSRIEGVTFMKTRWWRSWW